MKLYGSGTFLEAIKYTYRTAKKYDETMRWYVVFLVVYTGATILLPLITVDVINALVNTNNWSYFVILATVLLSANIVKVMLRAVINIYTDKREFKYGKRLEMISMEKFFNKKGEFYINNKSGDIMEIIMNDNMQLAEFTYQIYRTIADIVNSVAILIVLAYLEWDLVLILMIFLPFILILQNNLEWKLDEYYVKLREERAKEISMTEEFASNAALIASHGIKQKCRRKYRSMLCNLTNFYKKIATFSNLSYSTLEGTIVLSIAGAIIYEGYKIFNGWATIGVLVAFIQYSDFLIEPGRLVASLRVQGNKLMPSIKRIKKIFDFAENENTGACPEFDNFDIEFSNVGFSYPNGKEVFKQVKIKMKSQKTHVIIGGSGKGKTTMIHLITGLWEPTKGKLYIGGHAVDKLNTDYLRQHISLVSQDNLFFNETIRENLVDEEGKYTDNELYMVLKKVGMSTEILEMPHKLDTELGDRGYCLSGGQRQRLAIAKALLKDAPIIIFDEPTSSLDEETEQIIFDTIKALRNKTVLVITHRRKLMDVGDYIYQIVDGDIREI